MLNTSAIVVINPEIFSWNIQNNIYFSFILFLGIFAILVLATGITSVVYGSVLLIRYIGIPYSFGIFSLYCASIALICIGGLIIITLLLSVIGALKDNGNLRVVALVLAVLLFISLAVIGTWAMVIYKTNRLHQSIDNEWKDLNLRYHKNDEKQRAKVDWLNNHHNCCGTSDFTNEFKDGNVDYPTSCCLVPGAECQKSIHDKTPTNYKKGCASIYRETKLRVVYQLAIISLASAGAMLLAIILYSILTKRAGAGYAVVSQ